MERTNLLQRRINELNSGILNFVGNKYYLTGFYNEDRLKSHIEKKIQNFSSKGIYAKNHINFYNSKNNALFFIQNDGETLEKVQFKPIHKELVQYKNKPGFVTITIRKNAFKDQYNFLTEKTSSVFDSKEELMVFLQNEFKEEIIFH